MIRPTTPVANRVNARELAAARAARAAEISRRAAAARRRMTLAIALALVTAAVVTGVASARWPGVGRSSPRRSRGRAVHRP
jgi:hypothetical protein